MPAGPAGMGFVYFAAVKLAGYTAYCHWGIRPRLSSTPPATPSLLKVTPPLDTPPAPNSLFAGAIRTVLGIGIGAAVGLSFWKIPLFIALGDKVGDAGSLIFYVLLIPIRVAEWWILLHTIYRQFPLSRKTESTFIGAGILTSFALDAIGVLTALILPGGMWVC